MVSRRIISELPQDILSGIHTLFSSCTPVQMCTHKNTPGQIYMCIFLIRICPIRICTCPHHSLSLASAPCPLFSRHRPSPQLAVLCSSRPFIPPSFHPSIRPCPVIYNSSGILTPSTPLHQDSINILFGPQLRCTHVHMLCASEESFLGPASEALFVMAAIVAVCVRFVLALPAFLCQCRDHVACLAVCLLLVLFFFFSCLCMCQVSCLSHLLVPV